MAITKVKWHMKGFYDLRSAPGVVTDLTERAERIARSANDKSANGGYAVGHRQGQKGPIPSGQEPFYEGSKGFQGRYRATVITSNFDAILDSARSDTLARSLDGGR